MRARIAALLVQSVAVSAVPALVSPAQPAPRRIVSMVTAMKIDTDGLIADSAARRRHRSRDRWHREGTSLCYRGGRALDPNRVPYVVIPLGERGVSLGDFVVVSWRGRSVLAVVGDRGPRFGEASIATADALGINSDGLVGGEDGGVAYAFFPRSGTRPRTEAELLRSLRRYSAPLIAEAADAGQMVASAK